MFISTAAVDNLKADLIAEGEGGYVVENHKSVDIDGEKYYPGPVVISYVEKVDGE